MEETQEGLGCPLKLWIVAAIVGFVVTLFLLFSGYAWLAAIFLGVVTTGLLGLLLTWLICHPGERVRAAPATEPVDPLTLIAGEADTQEAAAPAPAAAAPMAAATPSPVAQQPESAASAPVAAAPGAGTRPAALDGPRAGGADDLKKIKGVGPKLELLLNSLGFYHFDQVAGWSADEIAWVDQNLAGFKGRVTRDDWVAQAKTLAAGGETAFSQKVEKGGVY
ncbi:hypothetical protein [Actibacterium sp. D379-3]